MLVHLDSASRIAKLHRPKNKKNEGKVGKVTSNFRLQTLLCLTYLGDSATCIPLVPSTVLSPA